MRVSEEGVETGQPYWNRGDGGSFPKGPEKRGNARGRVGCERKMGGGIERKVDKCQAVRGS